MQMAVVPMAVPMVQVPMEILANFIVFFSDKTDAISSAGVCIDRLQLDGRA